MWVLTEIKIYLDSKLSDVRLAKFMSELLPVLKKFSPQPNDRPHSREVCKVKQVRMGYTTISGFKCKYSWNSECAGNK